MVSGSLDASACRIDSVYTDTIDLSHKPERDKRTEGKKMKLVETDQKVTIKWFVYAGNEKIAHSANQRGNWGYDVECSCGWKTSTGGATRSYIKEEVQFHKYTDHNYKWDNTPSRKEQEVTRLLEKIQQAPTRFEEQHALEQLSALLGSGF
ncbi:hypothetical protein UFOVP1462_25 [uncultured Caudovirales phage]|uniref:Uncharacterized protein n=1 Tax=uncultured Caudovirales phage TaxID=2100421 RepID=A0A6J7XF06_9CAUD|nr:hypothetical protein UFOVP1013_25 [uncultured Caudovirales phage]CAB4202869.1 hypothetical protein UFOVP1364_42 [uncultured Caudovirales phage]CAB4214240.1 hypothetical protein UFOVP1462_25 [uncultured Caudovirales phage]CAB5228759.1 hypothetical protein UFOVP1550_34 [uncultured Caudovirales phage]